MREASSSAIFDLLARLLGYPGPETAAQAEACAAFLRPRDEAAGAEMSLFHGGVSAKSLDELEELYSATFEISAPCCLDVGYQLFGESYKRGAFLVKMTETVRRHGVDPSPELADHLPVVLRLIPRLAESEEPRDLVVEAVLPAAAAMRQFIKTGNPYGSLMASLGSFLMAEFGVEEMPEAPPRNPTDFPEHDSKGGKVLSFPGCQGVCSHA